MGFWEKTKGFLLSPSETFNSVKDEDWGGSIGYFAKWQVIYTILMTIIAAALMVWIRGLLLSWAGLYPEVDIAQITWLFDLFAGPMLIGWGVISFISGLIGILVGSLWMHIWVYVCGGRKGVGQTIKAIAYGSTPSLLLGWIPFVSIIFSIWSLVVQIIGIRQLHEISTGRAILAYIIAIIIPIIIFAIIWAVILSALFAMILPT